VITASTVWRRFRVTYHANHISRLLRSLGFSPQKPERRARERDEEAIRGWVRSEWPRVKKNAWRLKASLVFIDESGLLMAPLVRRTWAPVGSSLKTNPLIK